MGAQEKWDAAKARAAEQEKIRKAVQDLGESNNGNRDQRLKKLVDLTGSQGKAEKAYRDFTGGGGAISKLFGRRR